MERYVSSRLAAKAADDMLSPLIPDDDGSEEDSDVESVESFKLDTIKPTPTQVLKSLIVYLVLSAGIASSVAAMVYAPVVITYIMGGVCIANVPYSIIKERKLSKMPTLRAMNNKLREEANSLKKEVDVLAEEIDALKPEANRAASMEEELRGIAEKQSYNVNGLIELVKENESILVQMRDNLRQRIFQDMVTLVMKSDRDNNHIIDKAEADLLALRIRLQLEQYGVEFDSNKFLRAVGNNPSVPCVLSLAQKLFRPMGETVVDEESDESDDSDSSDDDDDDDDVDDDIYDMFYVAEDNLRKTVNEVRCKPDELSTDRPTTEKSGPASCSRRLSLMISDKSRSSRRASLLSSSQSHMDF